MRRGGGRAAQGRRLSFALFVSLSLSQRQRFDAAAADPTTDTGSQSNAPKWSETGSGLPPLATSLHTVNALRRPDTDAAVLPSIIFPFAASPTFRRARTPLGRLLPGPTQSSNSEPTRHKPNKTSKDNRRRAHSHVRRRCRHLPAGAHVCGESRRFKWRPPLTFALEAAARRKRCRLSQDVGAAARVATKKTTTLRRKSGEIENKNKKAQW